MNIQEHLHARHVRDYQAIILGEGCCYFPLYTVSGKLVGMQKYNPDGTKTGRGTLRREGGKKSPKLKYLTYTAEGEIGVWGLHSYQHNSPFIFLTEGVFDAVTIHNAGYPAIAMIANDPIHAKQWVKLLPCKKIVIADNDAAGNKLRKYGDASYSLPDYKDLNDAPQPIAHKFLHNLVNTRT